MRHVTALFCLLAALLPAAARDEIDDKILAELYDTKTTEERVVVLARLAWGEDSDDEALAQRARKLLVESGKKGLHGVADAFNWAPPERYADILLAGIENEQLVEFSDSPQMIPSIEKCIWFGTPDAKRLAMDYMTVRPARILLNAVTDVAYDHPELKLVVIDTLGVMGDERARFFLADQLQNGTPLVRRRAAEALATIGGRAREYLRAWSLAEDSELRQISFRALLPVAGVGDLTTLYEYLTLFPEDDPETLDALRARATLIEEALAAQEETQDDVPGIDE